MHIIDLGACVGEWIGRFLGLPDTIIHAFEPMPYNYERLYQRYSNAPNVILNNVAIAGFEGTAKLNTGKYEKAMDCYWGPSLHLDKYNNSHPKEYSDTCQVKVIKLSDYWKQNINEDVLILKMNVEGAEYDIFEDLMQADILNRFKKIIYQDHGIRGAKIIPSCRDKAYEIFPKFYKEYKGKLLFMTTTLYGITEEIPEYLRKTI